MDWYIWLLLGFGIGVVISFVICEYMAVQQSRDFDEVARKYVATISRQRDDLLAIVDIVYGSNASLETMIKMREVIDQPGKKGGA